MTRRNIINLVMFQVGWFACVLGAANHAGWIGVVTVLLLVVFHLIFSNHFKQDLALVLFAGLVGYAWESFLSMLGIVSYSDNAFGRMAPLWMAALWVNFAITINWSLAWFKRHLLVAAVSGLLFAPLAYYAGFRLNALDFPQLWTAMLAIGVGWALLFPFLCWFALTLNSEKLREGGNHV